MCTIYMKGFAIKMRKNMLLTSIQKYGVFNASYKRKMVYEIN